MSTQINDDSSKKCPLCGKDNVRTRATENNMTCYICTICGEFIADALYCAVKSSSPNHLLSGVAREHWVQHSRPLRISNTNCKDILKLAPKENDVIERSFRLLRTLSAKAVPPEQMLTVQHKEDFPYAYCKTPENLDYFLVYLVSQGLLEKQGACSGGWYGRITPEGWSFLDSHRQANIESDKVFVAMWFDSTMDEAWKKGIEAAIDEDCGYKSLRIDNEEFLGDFVDKIISEIRESRFVVADVTGHRKGVYFEAGFAMGLDLPVIWTCRKDDMEKTHSDTNHFNHVVWETPEDLREKLKNRIGAVIGHGPHRETES